MDTSFQSELPMSSSKDLDVMNRWRSFFQLKEGVSDEAKCLYAIGKLTHVALVQYMRLRKVYAESSFKKRNYGEYRFYTMNLETAEGAKVNKILRTASEFINATALKAFRFQLFHDPDKPQEIGEEIHFMYHYGKESRVTLSFGNSDNVELDLSDCTFEAFLRCFGEIIGKVRNYCAHLSPLPSTCEKRFRSSFCKKLPPGLNTGDFNAVSGAVEYAPEMYSKDVGCAQLPGVAMAAILRTCYSNEEIDQVLAENVDEMVQTEVNEIMSQGRKDLFLEVPRQSQQREEMSYQNTVLEEVVSSIAPAAVPVLDVIESQPVDTTAVQVSPVNASFNLSARPSQIASLLSPAYTHASIVSFEAVLSPYPRLPLVHESTMNVETTRSTEGVHEDINRGSDRSQEKSERKKKKSERKSDKEVLKPTRTSTRKKNKINYAEDNSSDERESESSSEDSHVRRRKVSEKRKLSNREAIEEISKSQTKKRRRDVK